MTKPLIKAGQGRDEEDLMFSAIVCVVCLVGAVAIVLMRTVVSLFS